MTILEIEKTTIKINIIKIVLFIISSMMFSYKISEMYVSYLYESKKTQENVQKIEQRLDKIEKILTKQNNEK